MITEQIEKTMEALRKNNMDAYYVQTAAEAKTLVLSLIPKGAVCASGGSVTLVETGILDALKSEDYHYIDRGAAGLSAEEKEAAMVRSMTADCYLVSSNAITEDGTLYNVDGNSNRVSAMLYGPKSVIVVAGVNKLVKNLDEAVQRVKTIAAPKNCKRLGCGTYCFRMGKCVSLESGADNADITDGCMSDARICCNYVVMAHQRQKLRIKVVIVGEELGY